MDQRKTSDLLNHSERFLSETQRRWMQPLGSFDSALRRALYGVNWFAMKLLFRVSVTGREHLPKHGPFIIAPNHASSLDPFVLAAALPYCVLSQTCWAGLESSVMRNRLRRFVNRLAHVIPIKRDMRALAVGAAVLKAKRNLVWFPEGTRSTSGEVQEFKPGIGLLMNNFDVPAIPIYLTNTYENWPPHAYWPKHLRRITISFGAPVWPTKPNQSAADSPERAEAIANEVRDEVAEAKIAAKHDTTVDV